MKSEYMQNRDFKIIELRANKILQDLSIRKAPVDVEKVAEHLGIKISFAPSEEYSGMLLRKTEGQVLMGINSNEPKTRMRFTIAHEIGHYLFDKGNAVSIDYRSTFQLIDKPTKEIRADLFAANLLMPKKFLTIDFEKVSSKFSEEDLTEIAKKYQVSKDAMKYRLANLRLIKLV